MENTHLTKMQFNREIFFYGQDDTTKDNLEPVCDRVIELVDSALKELNIRSNNSDGTLVPLSQGDFQRLLFIVSLKSMHYENSRLSNLTNKLSSYLNTTATDVVERASCLKPNELFQSHE